MGSNPAGVTKGEDCINEKVVQKKRTTCRGVSVWYRGGLLFPCLRTSSVQIAPSALYFLEKSTAKKEHNAPKTYARVAKSGKAGALRASDACIPWVRILPLALHFRTKGVKMKISLYIPKNSQCQRRFIRKEIAQSMNIKSKATRKSVVSGLRKIMAILPDNQYEGMAIFTDGT